jgi:MFS family permease
MLSKENAFMMFIICGALGPILGVGLSGFIFDKIGGYNGFKVPLVISALVGISGTMALLSVASVNQVYVTIMILGELFLGGLCVPVLTGYMLNTVPKNLQTEANSIANLTYNLLGFFPAPSIYGVVYQMNGGGNNRYGLLTI